MEPPTIFKDYSLKYLNTFGVDVAAKQFARFRSIAELSALIESEEELFLLGGGSNLLLTDKLDYLVLKNEIFGIQIIERSNDKVIVKCGGGEVWHDFVLWCIYMDFGGVENLSLIPGCVGTAPIQNIGAYGVEIKDVMHSLEAFDLEKREIVTFSTSECGFGYRDSVFKNKLKGKFCITSVTFVLTTKDHPLHIDYGNIKDKLEAENTSNPSIKDISESIISIRQSKLPDPAVIGNSGSFFKNPVVSQSVIDKIKESHPDLRYFDHIDGMYKIPAAWLIDKLGLKGARNGDAGIYEKHALVLVNHGEATGKELHDFAMSIKSRVIKEFGIELIPEVNVI